MRRFAGLTAQVAGLVHDGCGAVAGVFHDFALRHVDQRGPVAVTMPAYDDADEAYLFITPIVGFTPHYDNEDEDDLTHTLVQPMPLGGWDAIEHPEQQVIRRPDGWFIDPQGLIGSEAATLERFRTADRRYVQHQRPCRYKAALLLDYEE